MVEFSWLEDYGNIRFFNIKTNQYNINQISIHKDIFNKKIGKNMDAFCTHMLYLNQNYKFYMINFIYVEKIDKLCFIFGSINHRMVNSSIFLFFVDAK